MNKWLLILLLVCSHEELYSQFYRPFPEGEAVWTLGSLHINQCPIQGSSGFTQYLSYIIQIGDTLIHDMSYHKIYREPIYNVTQGAFPYLFADTGYLGALRQDINLKQVYVFFKGDSTERLLYDFSVDSLGSPFPNTFTRPDNSAKLFLIDTGWLVNSNGYTLRFVYTDTATDTCGNSMVYTMAEGIGGFGGGLVSKAGYFVAPGTTNYLIQESILCFSINGNLVSQPNNDSVILADASFCVTSLTAGFTELPGKYHIKLFPSPTTDEINVVCNDLPSGHTYFYEVINLSGISVIPKKEIQPEGSNISCKYLVQGLYLWQITDEQGYKLAFGKLVKQ